MSGWKLPGYRVERLLVAGRAGELWLARERSTLETVAVRVLTADSADDLDRLRREAVAVAGVRHPHLVRVRTVLPIDGGVALVSDFAPGGSLAALLAARGALTPGEVLTVGAPLATALAAAHAKGRVHGGVSATSVLFSADGRPLLADLGLAALVDEAGGATPADDVLALGEVLALMLDAAAPADLRACVERAVAVDPAARPSADELARQLRRTGRPEPLRLRHQPAVDQAPRDDPPHRPDRAERVLPQRPPVKSGRPSVALLTGLPVAVTIAVLAGRTWAAADRPTGPPPLQALRSAAPSVPATEDWFGLLARLDDRRGAALVNLDVAALADVYAAGSAPMAVDAAAIRELAAAGAHAEGLRLQLEFVRLVRRTPSRVTLRVVDWRPAYDVVGADGRVLARRPGRGAAAWLVDVVPAGDGWRIAAWNRA